MNKLISSALLLVGSMVSQVVWGQTVCRNELGGTPTWNYVATDVRNPNFTPASPIGTHIAFIYPGYTYSTGPRNRTICTPVGAISGTISPTLGGAYDAATNSYSSGVPGVGLRIYMARTQTQTAATMPPQSAALPDTRNYTITNLTDFTLFNQSPLYAAFSAPYGGYGALVVYTIKTGPITEGGVIPGGRVAQLTFPSAGNFDAYFWNVGPRVINPGTPTCSVTTPSVPVSLDTVESRVFTGVGTPSPEVRFNIGLNCTGGAVGINGNAYMTLTDQTNPANRGNILSLTADSVARGVGIQILDGSGNVVSYGADSAAVDNPNRFFAAQTRNGVVNIPLSARYVQTEPMITNGSANGRATFTMSYQ